MPGACAQGVHGAAHDQLAGAVPAHRVQRVGDLGAGVLRVGVVDVQPGAVGEHRVGGGGQGQLGRGGPAQGGGAHARPGAAGRGGLPRRDVLLGRGGVLGVVGELGRVGAGAVEPEAAGVGERVLPGVVPAHVAAAPGAAGGPGVGGDHVGREHHRVGARVARLDEAVLGLDAHGAVDAHARALTGTRRRGVTVSTSRPSTRTPAASAPATVVAGASAGAGADDGECDPRVLEAALPRPAAGEGADVGDPLALLAAHARPVVGVGGVGQVLVLAHLRRERAEQVLGAQAPPAGGEQVLDGPLLRAVDDVGDHRAGGEVLEVQHLPVAAGVGDLEELVLRLGGVQRLHDGLDHRRDGGGRVVAVGGELVGVQRQVRR